MWAIDAAELIKRLKDLRDDRDLFDPVDLAIVVGLDRAITEILLMDPIRRD